jgi:hypothetical protein
VEKADPYKAMTLPLQGAQPHSPPAMVSALLLSQAASRPQDLSTDPTEHTLGAGFNPSSAACRLWGQAHGPDKPICKLPSSRLS